MPAIGPLIAPGVLNGLRYRYLYTAIRCCVNLCGDMFASDSGASLIVNSLMGWNGTVNWYVFGGSGVGLRHAVSSHAYVRVRRVMQAWWHVGVYRVFDGISGSCELVRRSEN